MVGEKINKSLIEVIGKHEAGGIFMMELPTDVYFEASYESIKTLISKEFEGVYVSFLRPFKSIDYLLKHEGIDTNKLIFIDVASALTGGSQEKNERCVHISPEIDIDELVRAIYTALTKLQGRKRFIFLDSLSTIALYKPLSEILRFSEFLVRAIRKQEGSVLLINVAKDLNQKKFIKNIALRVDEVIKIENV